MPTGSELPWTASSELPWWIHHVYNVQQFPSTRACSWTASSHRNTHFSASPNGFLRGNFLCGSFRLCACQTSTVHVCSRNIPGTSVWLPHVSQALLYIPSLSPIWPRSLATSCRLLYRMKLADGSSRYPPHTHFVGDDAWFHLSGYVNSQNKKQWCAENLIWIFEMPFRDMKLVYDVLWVQLELLNHFLRP
jgi:hypothetical protein